MHRALLEEERSLEMTTTNRMGILARKGEMPERVVGLVGKREEFV
jgi:hypothetical protein